MKPMSARVRSIYFYAFLIIFVVAIPALLIYANGYSLDFNRFLSNRSGIYISVPDVSSEIYINGELKKETGFFQREFFAQDLRPGSYEVSVLSDGMIPWTKVIDLKKRQVTPLYPFLFPAEIMLEPVPQFAVVYAENGTTTATTTNYLNALKLFEPDEVLEELVLIEEDTLATTATSTDTEEIEKINYRNLYAWIDEESLMAEWQDRGDWVPDYFCLEGVCKNPMTVFKADSEIKKIEFIPWRDDVLIFATNNQVAVVEVDKRDKQFFAQIYFGNEDVDFKISGDTLLIKDGLSIFKTSLENIR